MVNVLESAKKQIYLACPYSDGNPLVRQERYQLATQISAALMKQGHSVFSPITQGHHICEYGVGYGFDAWKNTDLSIIELWATDFYVLCIENFEQSQGVKAEIEYANKLERPIVYIYPNEISTILVELNFFRSQNQAIKTMIVQYNDISDFCKMIDSGRGIYKRIDENRELLEFLQKQIPNLTEKFPFIETWIGQQDIFLVVLTNILQLEKDPGFKNLPFPRPWPGSFSLDNTYQEFLDCYVPSWLICYKP